MSYLALPFVFLCLAFANLSKAYMELPDYIHPCHASLSKEEIGQCFTDNVAATMHIFAEKVPPLGVPTLVPMYIPKMVISPKSSGLYLSVENVTLYHSELYQPRKFDVYEHTRKYEMFGWWDKIHANGTYNLNGKILMLQLKGHGPFTAHMEGVKFRALVDWKFRKLENGTEQMYLEDLKVGCKFTTCKVHLGNLFDGRDEALANTVNEAINSNIDLFAGELMPLIEKEFAKIFRKIADTFTSHFTKEQLFPGLEPPK